MTSFAPHLRRTVRNGARQKGPTYEGRTGPEPVDPFLSRHDPCRL